MDNLDLNGKIVIEGERHDLEYEPEMHLGTVFLRVKDGNKNVPIYFNQIDSVIEMLSRAKKAIEALEGK
jgi:hypothetical protein